MTNSTSIEKLSFLKWTLGVPKGTSNAAVYGDTGRIPLVLSILTQFVKNFKCICGAKTTQAPLVHSGTISYSTTRSKKGIRAGTQNKNITKCPSL